MSRCVFVGCLVVVGSLLHLGASAGTQPKPAGCELCVIVKARLYEVDEAFHKKLVKTRWQSKADLEELEDKPADGSLFAILKKEKPILVGKEINIDPGKEGALLTAIKPVKHLASPDRLRLGLFAPQTIDEGFTLRAQVHISADRRFVRAKFLEKSLEIEGVERVDVVVDDDEGTEAVGESVSVAESSTSRERSIPDGGTILLPLQYRPRAAREKDRWLVAEIAPRIYIEEEERERRGAPKK